MFLPNIKYFQKISSCVELVYLPHFHHNFWRKIFLMLYSTNWTSFIVWLLLLQQILCNMCIAVVCSPRSLSYDIENFWYSTNFRFTTGETVCDYYLQTWYIRVASPLAERFKTWDLRKLRDIRKPSKLQRIIP